jgi:uncharacterized protein
LDFFVYSRDATGAGALRDDDELLEAHWSYMDRFAHSMIARGPTLDDDRETATGSLHIVGLPSVAAAWEFVAHEPNNCAGLYAAHAVWRFENLLGGTMWEFSGPTDEPRFLVIARSDPGRSSQLARPEGLSAELRARLIVYGALATLDDNRPVGFALAAHAPDSGALEALLASGRLAPGNVAQLEVHNWELGGRR